MGGSCPTAVVPPVLNCNLAACRQDPFVCQLRYLQFTHFGAAKDSGSSPPSSVVLGLKELSIFFSLVLVASAATLHCTQHCCFSAEGPCRGNIFWLCSCRQHKPLLELCPVEHHCNRACEVCAGPMRAEALVMPTCPLDPLAN